MDRNSFTNSNNINLEEQVKGHDLSNYALNFGCRDFPRQPFF